MSDLLSSQDWADFRAAIQDVTDTFMNHDVIYHQMARHYSNWNEQKEDETTETDYNLKGLTIYDKTGNSALNSRFEIGSMDLSEGYVLFGWWDLNSLGLIDPTTKEVVFNANIDEMTLFGTRYTLIGQEPVGPVEDVGQPNSEDAPYALIKVHFKRRIQAP